MWEGFLLDNLTKLSELSMVSNWMVIVNEEFQSVKKTAMVYFKTLSQNYIRDTCRRFTACKGTLRAR